MYRKDCTEHSNAWTDGEQVSLCRESNAKEDMEAWKSLENSDGELIAFKV